MKNVNFFLKTNLNLLAILMVFTTLMTGKGISQTTLAQGDLNILAFRTGSAGTELRGLTFVTWVELLPETVIKFTDNGFHAVEPRLSSTATNYRNKEQTLEWTSPSNSNTPAGTVVVINGTFPYVAGNLYGSVVMYNSNGPTSSTSMSLTSTDNLFAYQSSPGLPADAENSTFTGSGTLLYGFGWTTNTTPTTFATTNLAASGSFTNIPTDLPAGYTHYFTSTISAQYTGSRTSETSIEGYKTLVNNFANWTTYGSGFGAITLNNTSFGFAASINTHPNSPSICAGSNTNITVSASNAASYQWEVSTAGTSGSYTTVSNSGVYSGATSATLTITGATAGMNGYAYRCVVTGTNATTTNSNGGVLTISSAPSITTQPSSTSVCATGNPSFSVVASNATGYQWKVSTNSGSSYNNVSNGGVYSNATTATLNITSATTGMNGFMYICVVTGACSPAETSGAGTLTVNQAPTISQNPFPQTNCEGDGAVFSIGALNATGYFWQVDRGAGAGYVTVADGTDPFTGAVYSGATTSTLYLNGLTNAMSGYRYRGVATSPCTPNATSTSRLLTVLPMVTYYQDADADGYGNPSITTVDCGSAPDGYVSNFDDCDDNDPNVNPMAVEICYDGIDNNCDGNVDEGCVELTQIDPSYCGITIEYLNTQYIPAEPVVGAEQYEFRITNGAYVATATDDLQAGKIRFLQFAGYEYNTTYEVAVRAKVGGVWGTFGSECSVLTTPAPHSELDPAQCGTTLTAMNTTIYTSTVNGATQYRFRIIDGANVQIIDRPVRSFNMSMLGSYEYSTTYTIDVAVEFDGSWWPYSASCSITTPSLSSSSVLPSQCNTTLAAVTSSIFSSQVSGATQYRYRVTNGASVQSIDKSTASFKLTELPTYAFSTTYMIEVAVEYGGMWQAYGSSCSVTTPAIALTQVQASQCGTTLASMTTYIYANTVSGATQYRFRFTEGANTQTYVSTTRAMNVTMLANHKANTTYSVEVAAMLNGTWGAYGSVCTITTPSVPTKIQSSQCGTTLSKLDKLIYADVVNLATAYRFRVTNGANVQMIDRTTNSFYLTQLGSYAYGINYTIDVSVQYGGVWQPYGSACVISTPAAGSVTTTLVAASCNVTVSDNGQSLIADKVVGATQYEFLVENAGLSYSQSVVNNTFTFTLSQLTGIANSTTYTVKVRTKVNNIWSPYGTACNVTSAGSGMRPGSDAPANTSAISASRFDAVIFPNPFGSEFGVNVSTSSDEMVAVAVYDMAGKLMSSHSLSPQELGTLKIGAGFAAGIYQVQVVQGTDVKTLKVVKQ